MSDNNSLSINKIFTVGSQVTIASYISDAAGRERIPVTTAQITSITLLGVEQLSAAISMTAGELGVYSASFSTAGWLPGTYTYVCTFTSGAAVQHHTDRFVLRGADPAPLEGTEEEILSGLIEQDIALDLRLDAVESGLAAHLADTSDAHDASAISVVPGGSISSTNVQAALSEIAALLGSASTPSYIIDFEDYSTPAEALADGWLFAAYNQSFVEYTNLYTLAMESPAVMYGGTNQIYGTKGLTVLSPPQSGATTHSGNKSYFSLHREVDIAALHPTIAPGDRVKFEIAFFYQPIYTYPAADATDAPVYPGGVDYEQKKDWQGFFSRFVFGDYNFYHADGSGGPTWAGYIGKIAWGYFTTHAEYTVRLTSDMITTGLLPSLFVDYVWPENRGKWYIKHLEVTVIQ